MNLLIHYQAPTVGTFFINLFFLIWKITFLQIKKTKAKDSSSFSESTSSFIDFLDTYAQKLESLDAIKYELDKEIKTLKEQIDVAYNNLRKLNVHNSNAIM